MSQINPGSVHTSLLKPTAIYMFLGYILWPFCLIGLYLEREDDFLRFHMAQAMALCFAQIALGILWFIGTVLTVILIGFLILPLAGIGFVAAYVFIILAMVKACKGERYSIPWLGSMAEKHIMGWFKK
jgi:uncharacterized protein